MAGHITYSTYEAPRLIAMIRTLGGTVPHTMLRDKDALVARALAREETVEAEFDALFHELVPASGPAATTAGNLLRAVGKAVYRYYNDGDGIQRTLREQGTLEEQLFAHGDLWRPVLDIGDTSSIHVHGDTAFRLLTLVAKALARARELNKPMRGRGRRVRRIQ